MPDKEAGYNDRALSGATEGSLPTPQIEIIVDGNKIFKPGMKTFFVEEDTSGSGALEGRVMGTYCSCDTVLTQHVVCTCEHVCTCESVCSCVGYSAPSGGGTTCTCQSVSCGSPCACVPVH